MARWGRGDRKTLIHIIWKVFIFYLENSAAPYLDTSPPQFGVETEDLIVIIDCYY